MQWAEWSAENVPGPGKEKVWRREARVSVQAQACGSPGLEGSADFLIGFFGFARLLPFSAGLFPLLFPLQTGQQILRAGPPQLMQLKQFHHAAIGTPSGVQLEQHGCDQRQIQLDRHALLALGQPVAAAQEAFEPAKETFNLPAPPAGGTRRGTRPSA